MTATDTNPVIVLGKITVPYGIQGWVRIHPFADDPLAWAKMPEWWVATEKGDGAVEVPLAQWRSCKLKQCRWHGDGLVARLEGVDDRNAAEALQGFLVGAPREAMPATSENEFYWTDLIGLDVVNTRDEKLGQVVGLIETGANDVLRVAAEDGEERLLPFVAAVVLAVEQADHRIRVEWEKDW